MTKKSPSIREQTLHSATSAVMGERQDNYGGPEDNFLRIVRLWNAHLKNIGIVAEGTQERILSTGDVALMLIMVKQGRLANKIDHPDSWTDIAGYAACGNEVSQNIESE